MISSSHRTASAMAATVARTRFPPSYCDSFLAAKIDAAISSTRLRPFVLYCDSHPIQYPALSNTEDNNGKSNQCASAASCGAARSAVARGEVGSSNFRDRVVERFGSIPQVGTTDPNSVRSFTAEKGAGTKSEMGKGSEGTEASSGESENNRLGSCQTHHVSISP
jgi:hypothetical protein